MAIIEKTDAIVLRTYNVRETSLLITFFTRNFGKIKTMSKGVRKKKSPLLRCFEPFVYQQIQFYYHPDREINFISDAQLKESFLSIRKDIGKICAASYMIDVLDTMLAMHVEQKNLFDMFLFLLCELRNNASALVLRFFEVKVLEAMGLFPNIEKCVICGAKRINDEPYVFSIAQSGIVCRDQRCRSRASESEMISCECIQILEMFKQNVTGGFENIKKTLIEKKRRRKGIEEEVKRFLQRFLKYQLNGELRTMKFERELRNTVVLEDEMVSLQR